jgi:hypothetical protein
VEAQQTSSEGKLCRPRCWGQSVNLSSWEQFLKTLAVEANHNLPVDLDDWGCQVAQLCQFVHGRLIGSDIPLYELDAFL